MEPWRHFSNTFLTVQHSVDKEERLIPVASSKPAEDSVINIAWKDPHLHQEIFRRNFVFFVAELFPWDAAITASPAEFLDFASHPSRRHVFPHPVTGERWTIDSLRMNIHRSFFVANHFRAEILRSLVANDAGFRMALDNLLVKFLGFGAHDPLFKDVAQMVDRYLRTGGEPAVKLRISVQRRFEDLPVFLTESMPVVPYQRRRHELKSIVHWGQRKLLMSEIQFLVDYASAGDLVVYAGAAPGTHTEFLGSLFSDIFFLLVDPCDFSFRDGARQGQIRLLHRTYFTDKIARAFCEEVKAGDAEWKEFLSSMESSYEVQIENLKQSQAQKIEKLLQIFHQRRRISMHELSQSVCGSTLSEDFEAWLDDLIPVHMTPSLVNALPLLNGGRWEMAKHRGCELVMPQTLSLHDRSRDGTFSEIRKHLGTIADVKLMEFKEMVRANIRNLVESKQRLERQGKVLFISDVRSACPGKMDEETTERYVKNDQDNQMRWVQLMKPKESMLKFRLPYRAGKTEYMDGIIYLPVWGPQTTTETRFVPKPSDGSVLKTWINEDYEGRMFHFNTHERTIFYDHLMANRHPYDRCFDCASEVHILVSYVRKMKGPMSEEQMRQEIHTLHRQIDSRITVHGKRTIRHHLQEKHFKSTNHTTNVESAVIRNAYDRSNVDAGPVDRTRKDESVSQDDGDMASEPLRKRQKVTGVEDRNREALAGSSSQISGPSQGFLPDQKEGNPDS